MNKKIPINCQLCKYNENNEYCIYNDKEDEFMSFEECDEFCFCSFHLIEFCGNILKKLEVLEKKIK